MRLCRTISMAMLIIMGFTSQSVLADDKRGNPFIGLWQGIDLEDGATHLRSIRRNKDGTFSLVGNTTYFTLCGGTNRGLITGTGTVENGVLEAKETVTCFNDGRTIEGLETEYVLDRENGTLTEQRKFGVPEPLIFHVISPRPEY